MKKSIILIVTAVALLTGCTERNVCDQSYRPFPFSLQYTPAPECPSFDSLTLSDLKACGVSNIWVRECDSPEGKAAVDCMGRNGFKIDFMTHGAENFTRDATPQISVYDPEYETVVENNVGQVLGQVNDIENIDYLFPYIDEPFHRKPFLDYSKPTQKEFESRYGYAMPLSIEQAAKSKPQVRLDFLNFQSDIFRDGWLKTQKAVKALYPDSKIAMTHDSHNVYGGGVGSNSQMAMDDVFHWGGDFADLFLYDIYPYLTFDYRYGETGICRKPRFSQLHYTMAQLRNMTSHYGKTMGFWVGTYNQNWFVRFRGGERAKQYWSEREVSYTAIAGGADYIISPSNYMGNNLPADTLHWNEYVNGMQIIQKEGYAIAQTPKAKAKICFLFPRSQYLLLQEEYYNVALSYELFLRAFGEVDIIHEEQLCEGIPDNCEALVMCDVKLLPDKAMESIERYVESGHTVVADCVPQLNEHLEPTDRMMKLFGVSSADCNRIVRSGQWVPFVNQPARFSFAPTDLITDSTPQTETAQFAPDNSSAPQTINIVSPRNVTVDTAQTVGSFDNGNSVLSFNGRASLFGFCLQDTYFQACKADDRQTLEGLYAAVGQIFARSGICSHVHSSNPDTEAGLRMNDRQGYLFVVNHESEQSHTDITLRSLSGRLSKIIDVETGKPTNFDRMSDGCTQLHCKVGWGKTKLYKLVFDQKQLSKTGGRIENR